MTLPLSAAEFMPKLEEGNLWVRASMPNTISFSYATQLMNQMRLVFTQVSGGHHCGQSIGTPGRWDRGDQLF